MQTPNQPLTDRQKYRNVERARRAIANRLMRELHFDENDVRTIADAIAARDDAQHFIARMSSEIVRAALLKS